MDKKEQAKPKQQKSAMTLTDRCMHNKDLSDQLAKHMNARNYLFGVATGTIDLPTLIMRPFFCDGPDTHDAVEIEMRVLPQELVNVILSAIIEHEERTAILLWQQLADNSAEACAQIQHMQQAVNEQLAQQAEEEGEDFSPTIPMKQPAPDQELPTSWPGRK